MVNYPWDGYPSLSQFVSGPSVAPDDVTLTYLAKAYASLNPAMLQGVSSELRLTAPPAQSCHAGRLCPLHHLSPVQESAPRAPSACDLFARQLI